MKKFFNLCWTLLLVVLVLAAVWVLLVRLDGGTPSFFGMRLYRVASGSMEPVYMIDDVILVKKVSPDRLKIGDDITYISQSGETKGMQITHRLIQQPYMDEAGTWHLQTQGVAAGAEADPPITGDQVIGKVIANVKPITWIYKLFRTKIGLVIFLLPLIWMMVGEIRNIVSFARKGESDDESKTGEGDNQSEDE